MKGGDKLLRSQWWLKNKLRNKLNIIANNFFKDLFRKDYQRNESTYEAQNLKIATLSLWKTLIPESKE